MMRVRGSVGGHTATRARQDDPVATTTPQPGRPHLAVIQRLARTAGNRAAARAAHAYRTSLPAPLRVGVEALSGLDMSDVRVHTDSPEPDRVGALAFTRGRDIHLAPGQSRHLPHEAWHVVQQKQGRVPPTVQYKSTDASIALNDDPALEREADVMGTRALRGPLAPSTPVRAAPTPTAAPIQRLQYRGAFALKASPVDFNDLSAKQCQRLLFDLRRGKPKTADGYTFEEGDEAALQNRLDAARQEQVEQPQHDPNLLDAAKVDFSSLKKALARNDKQIDPDSLFAMYRKDKEQPNEQQAEQEAPAQLGDAIALVELLVSKQGKKPSFAIGELHRDRADMALKAALMQRQLLSNNYFVFEQSVEHIEALRDAMLGGGNQKVINKQSESKREELAALKNAQQNGGLSPLLLGGKLRFGGVDISNFELATDIVDAAQQVYELLLPHDGQVRKISRLLRDYKGPPDDAATAARFLRAVGIDPSKLATFADVPGPMVLTVGVAHLFDVVPVEHEAKGAYDLMKKLGLGFAIIQERQLSSAIKRVKANGLDPDEYFARYDLLRCTYAGKGFVIVVPRD